MGFEGFERVILQEQPRIDPSSFRWSFQDTWWGGVRAEAYPLNGRRCEARSYFSCSDLIWYRRWGGSLPREGLDVYRISLAERIHLLLEHEYATYAAGLGGG